MDWDVDAGQNIFLKKNPQQHATCNMRIARLPLIYQAINYKLLIGMANNGKRETVNSIFIFIFVPWALFSIFNFNFRFRFSMLLCFNFVCVVSSFFFENARHAHVYNHPRTMHHAQSTHASTHSPIAPTHGTWHTHMHSRMHRCTNTCTHANAPTRTDKRVRQACSMTYEHTHIPAQTPS